MIDQTFGKPVADMLNKLSPITAATTAERGFRDRRADKDLIAFTGDDGCVLLTHDHNTINKHRYPPCTHGGIIIIKGEWFPETIYDGIKRLCESGKRKLIPHHVTYLYIEQKKAIIHTHKESVSLELPAKKKKT
jgi:hypothetical protein